MKNNFDNSIKNAIDGIEPDAYMKTRLAAKVGDYKKPHNSFSFKKAVAAALSLAIVCTSAGYIASRSDNDEGLDFTIVAYAKDEDDNIISQVELGEDTITALPKLQLYGKYDEEGNWCAHMSGTGGFVIKADDIYSVKVESELGSFMCWNTPLENHNKSINEHPGFVYIPLTDEEYKDYAENYASPVYYNREKDRKFVEKLMESRNCKEYFGNESTDLSHYDYDFYSKENSPNGINEVWLQNTDKVYDIYCIDLEKKVEIKLYEDTESPEIQYFFDEAFYNYNDEDQSLSELATDTIKITVKFNNGKKAVKSYKAFFNNDGILQLEYAD